MLRADRHCYRCGELRPWSRVRPLGGKQYRRVCVVCGGVTRRVRGRRVRDTLPAPLYRYRLAVKAANEVWRKLVYTYASPPGACAVCHQAKGLQAMHLFGKGAYPALRFDPDNGAPGCSGCHFRLGRDHEAHREFCIRFLGAERYEALRLRSMSRCKVDPVAAGVVLAEMLARAQPLEVGTR